VIKVLIIEDEAPAFRRLQKIMDDLSLDIEIIDVIDSVEESVKWLNKHEKPDLIFMDIQLSDGLSFEIFDRVKITRPVIFTTAFDDYMLKAFKVNSIDYLLKPIKMEDLSHSINKYFELHSATNNAGNKVDISELVKQIRLGEGNYKSRFLVKLRDKLVSVEVDNIACFRTHLGIVQMVTKQNKKYIMDSPLDDIMLQLDPSKFFRANRQYIVNFHAIEATHKYHKGKLLLELKPKSEEAIVISTEKSSEFKRWLGD